MRFTRRAGTSGDDPTSVVESAADGERGAARTRRRVVLRSLTAVVFAAAAFAGGFVVSRTPAVASQDASSVVIRESEDGTLYVANQYVAVDYNKDRSLPRGPRLISPVPSSCADALGVVAEVVAAAYDSGSLTLSELPFDQRDRYEQATLFAQHLCRFDEYVPFYAALDDFIDVGVSPVDIDAQGSLG